MARTSIDALNLNKAEGDSNTASRRSGATAPEATFYKPSYRLLNHITWSSDVSGQVNFAQAVGNTGQKLFDNMTSLKENEILSSKYDEIHKSLQEKSQAWKAQSETGEGYLEYISAEHAKLAENALSGILDPVFAGRMRNMLMRSKADWENGAFEEEQAMRTAYSLRTAQQTITNLNFDVANNPATYESGLEAMKTALAGYREVAGVQAFNRVYDEALKNFTYSYGLGLVQKDPANFEKLAKDGRLSVISPERIMHLQHMATDELKRRAFEAQKAEKAVELATLRDRVVTGLELIQKMDTGGANSVSKTTIENAQLPSGIKKNVIRTQNNIAELDAEELKAVDATISSVENGEGIAFLEPKAQLAFLDLMTPPGEDGAPSQSYSDRLKLAKRLGGTAKDKKMSFRIGADLMYSNNAEKVLKATEARQLSDNMNGVLLTEESPEEQYVRGMVQYRGGDDPATILRVRDEAKDRIEKIQSDPTRQATLASQASDFLGTKEYRKLVHSTWKENILSETMGGKVGWFSLNEQEENVKREFYQFFRGRMKTLREYGWTPNEAAFEISNEFAQAYGVTKLVPGKMMYKPPERVYSFDEETLKKKFRSFVSEVAKGYIKNKYKPSGYELKFEDSKLRYRASEKDLWRTAEPDLEWNPRAGDNGAYNVFFTAKNGERVYFTRMKSGFLLYALDFNKQAIIKESDNAKKSNDR